MCYDNKIRWVGQEAHLQGSGIKWKEGLAEVCVSGANYLH